MVVFLFSVFNGLQKFYAACAELNPGLMTHFTAFDVKLQETRENEAPLRQDLYATHAPENNDVMQETAQWRKQTYRCTTDKLVCTCLVSQITSPCFSRYSKAAANILNKQSRTGDKGWFSGLWVGRGANNYSSLKTKRYTGAWNLMGFSERST
jgi:hypothetical protein